MNRIDQAPATGTVDSSCKGLYRTGAAAAVIAAVIFRRNLDAEWMLLRETGIIHAGPTEAPSTVSGWFALLQQDRLLGLTMLNLFDLVNYALVGLLFLALFFALRKANPSWMYVAVVLELVGIADYFATNQALTMLWLSNQYAAATGDAQRALFLAAGQAVLAIHQNATYAGSGIYLSFLFASVAGLIVSAVMLRSDVFSHGTAYMGILANIFGLSYYIVLAFAVDLVFVPLSVSAIFLLVWYLQVGVRLWALGSRRTARPLRVAVPGE